MDGEIVYLSQLGGEANLKPAMWCLYLMKRLLWLARWVLVALGIVSAIALLAHVAFRPNASSADSEKYAVYSAHIEPDLTGDSHELGNRTGLVVIQKRTQYRFLVGRVRRVKATIPRLRNSVLFEFFIASLQDQDLETRFELPAKYELATDKDMNLYPSERFMARFPSSYGYLTFSPVAFNRDLTEAFFYTEHTCGMCGEGKYVFMHKVSGKWVVEGTASTWIS